MKEEATHAHRCDVSDFDAPKGLSVRPQLVLLSIRGGFVVDVGFSISGGGLGKVGYQYLSIET